MNHVIAIGTIALIVIFIEVRYWYKKEAKMWDKQMDEHKKWIEEADDAIKWDC